MSNLDGPEDTETHYVFKGTDKRSDLFLPKLQTDEFMMHDGIWEGFNRPPNDFIFHNYTYRRLKAYKSIETLMKELEELEHAD